MECLCVRAFRDIPNYVGTVLFDLFGSPMNLSCLAECCGLDCVMAHSAIALRKVFNESIATDLRDGMTYHTGFRTTFRRASEH